jgi:hypothetical protein
MALTQELKDAKLLIAVQAQQLAGQAGHIQAHTEERQALESARRQAQVSGARNYSSVEQADLEQLNKAKEDFILGGGMDTDGDTAGGLDSGGGKKAKTGT